MTTPTIAPSFSQGFALCTANGTLLGHTYRRTEEEAKLVLFPDNEIGRESWEAHQRDGWSVQFVYARIFTPLFFASKILPSDVTTEAEEAVA